MSTDPKYTEIRDLFDRVDAYGPLHIVIDDGNLEDHHLLFSLLEYISQNDPIMFRKDEVQLISKLLHIGDIDRDHIWNNRFDMLPETEESQSTQTSDKSDKPSGCDSGDIEKLRTENEELKQNTEFMDNIGWDRAER